MLRTRFLKALHAASTIWFLLAACCLTIAALRQAGINWWVIYSLSGQTAAFLFLLISAYLFAVFRSEARGALSTIEHPVTNSIQYMIVYSLMPFLGALTGLACVYDAETTNQIMMSILMGTLAATFGMWIILDPMLGLLEMLTPKSRAHRMRRKLEAMNIHKQQQKERESLLEKLEADEIVCREKWRQNLRVEAKELSEIASRAGRQTTVYDRNRGIELGLAAWQLGGLECMQELARLTAELVSIENPETRTEIEIRISTLWDGIGNWRHIA